MSHTTIHYFENVVMSTTLIYDLLVFISNEYNMRYILLKLLLYNKNIFSDIKIKYVININEYHDMKKRVA